MCTSCLLVGTATTVGEVVRNETDTYEPRRVGTAGDALDAVESDAVGEPCAPSELVGRSLWEEVSSAVDTQFYGEYHRAMDEQRPVSFESHSEPTATWFEVHAYPSVTGLSVYFRDVTDRKEREAALVERERETVFESGFTAREDGTGFGLHIVASHGWDTAVTESDSGGARFEVTGMHVE